MMAATLQTRNLKNSKIHVLAGASIQNSAREPLIGSELSGTAWALAKPLISTCSGVDLCMKREQHRVHSTHARLPFQWPVRLGCCKAKQLELPGVDLMHVSVCVQTCKVHGGDGSTCVK
jgi:hypothetical protein